MDMTKAFRVVYLKPEEIHFDRYGDTLSLTVTQDGVSVQYPRVVLRSCFPVSDSRVYLSVRDATEDEQPEIGIIEDWKALKPGDREAVAAELDLYYFVPTIHKIHDIHEELGFLYWTVETDKGTQEFVMRNSIIRNTRQVSSGHWLLIDVNDARHEITDVSELDSRSQKLLARFLSF
jgi:hypothetical protein